MPHFYIGVLISSPVCPKFFLIMLTLNSRFLVEHSTGVTVYHDPLCSLALRGLDTRVILASTLAILAPTKFVFFFRSLQKYQKTSSTGKTVFMKLLYNFILSIMILSIIERNDHLHARFFYPTLPRYPGKFWRHILAPWAKLPRGQDKLIHGYVSIE